MKRPALLLLFSAWAAWLAGLPPAAADTDVGNIAVIETDPTILQPGELFDLNNRSLTFTPRSGGGYTVSSATLNFDSNTGTKLNLGDDASVQQSLAFTFLFFGVNRTSVFINSNGNLTFGSGSTLPHFNNGSVTSLGSDLSTILDSVGGPPGIAVLWQDWNPAAAAAGNGVFANSLSDRLIVTWSGVPLFGTSTTATFQVVLFNTGAIRMSYQSVTTTPGGGYLVGISPGSSSQFRTTTIDLSQGGSSISTSPNSEPLAQVFGSSTGPLVHISAVARRFFNTHTDAFDQFVMFANFTHAMGNAFAFELTTRQTVSGINLSLLNDSSFFGSSGQLQSFLNMNRLGVYSSDLACLQNPICRIPGNNDSALTLMGQESGHQWLAFVKFDNAGTCSTLLLGRQLAHWSFFHDTDASDMEGNSWVDNSNGTFTTDEDTLRFSALDQYIMGLRSAASVPTFFFINNPTNTGGRTSSSTPQTGVTVSGTRQNVTVNQIQTCSGGARSPSSGFTAVNPTTTWKQAFVLLIPGGTTAPSADLTKIDTIRSGWQSYFTTATGGRGSVDTTLAIPVISVSPSSRDFFYVTVGSSADRNFTVQNTGGGTLTGTASTSAPFSVISGASYSLGAGASQTVTVRFSPTSAATFAGNVTFTGGGGATRPVTGKTFTALTSQVTPVRAVHFSELREAINTLRSRTTLGPLAQDPTLAVGTLVRAVHLTDLRDALNKVYDALVRARPSYTNPTIVPGQTVIMKIHIEQLRSAVIAAEQ